jgi:putative endonuclease
MDEKPIDGRKRLGSCAEDVAAALLEEAGYVVLERNWRFGQVGELDIICRRGDLLVFVEVRSCSTTYLKSPALTVNGTKQAQVVRVARCYMTKPWLKGLSCRFDVVAVTFQDGVPTRTEWIEDAFRPQSTVRSQVYQG